MRSDLTVRHQPVAPQHHDPMSAIEALRSAGAVTDRGDEEKVPWGRYFSAIWRYKFLIAAILALGTAAALFLARNVRDEYEATASLYLMNVQRTDDRGVGPVRSQGLFSPTGWTDIPKSPTILDPVARNLRLFVHPDKLEHRPLFATFDIGDDLAQGHYTVRTDSSGARYWLLTDKGLVVDSGAVGDSIGLRLGIKWAPVELPRASELGFLVQNARAAALAIQKSLSVTLPEDGNLLTLKLTGTDPKETARVLNEINRVFVNFADTMAKMNHKRVRETLAEQLKVAQAAFDSSALRYKQYSIDIVTKPTRQSPVAGGVEETRDPVFDDYMKKRLELRTLRNDIESIDSMITQVRARNASPTIFLSIPAVKEFGQELDDAIAAQRRTLAEVNDTSIIYTTEAKFVAAKVAQVDSATFKSVVPAAERLLSQLRGKARTDSARLELAATELKEIPENAIQERLLFNKMESQWQAFAMYSGEYQRAVMAEVSAMPEITLASAAVEPPGPSSVQAPRIIAMVMLVTIAIALALAVLLDRVDKKFRYADQATRDLGLTIVGAVPTLRRSTNWQKDPEAAAGMVEAFRSVRLALSHAFANGETLVVAVTSPGAGEGKSLVTENLALAMAEGGYRTLVIDGDTRRGELHATFNTDRRPGLLDHLAGKAPLSEAVRQTEHTNLWLLPSGTRYRHGPELLMTNALQPTINELRSRFDAIIVDTPPLSAGVDAFVLGTAAGNMVLVLRNGRSDRKLAEAKLNLLDRLPVRILGTVINDFKQNSSYDYYSYVGGYEAEGEDETEPSLSSRSEVPSLGPTKRG